MNAPAIHWFRRDLRLADNPALAAAAEAGRVVPVFILDPDRRDEVACGAAGRAWLHRSLEALEASFGAPLGVFLGDPAAILPALAARTGARRVTWTRACEQALLARDEQVRAALAVAGVEGCGFPGSLLWEPAEVRKADGTPYRVFTPFWQRGCSAAPPPRRPLPRPRFEPAPAPRALPLAALELWPAHRWADDVLGHWQPGEAGAAARLAVFRDDRLAQYAEGRDFPARDVTSRLSPHLHFGEISPNQVWHALPASAERNVAKFRAELGWREFAWNLLHHEPDLATRPLRPEFARFPWREDGAGLARWRRGLTGIPFVDAGMRELWATGWMHNRARMVAASFLVKNLLVDWRAGEAWFRDTLVDADPANNAAGWQWVAGSGADAAPFFRIFNPVL